MIGCHPKFNTPATAQCKSCKVIVFTIIVSHNHLFFLMSASHSFGGAFTGLEASDFGDLRFFFLKNNK